MSTQALNVNPAFANFLGYRRAASSTHLPSHSVNYVQHQPPSLIPPLLTPSPATPPLKRLRTTPTTLPPLEFPESVSMPIQVPNLPSTTSSHASSPSTVPSSTSSSPSNSYSTIVLDSKYISTSSPSSSTTPCSSLPSQKRKYPSSVTAGNLNAALSKHTASNEDINRQILIDLIGGHKTFHCKTCKKSFPTDAELKQHKKLDHVRPFACHVQGCSASFSKANHLSRHIRIVHNKERPFACTEPGCGARFGSKSHLGDHTRAVHMRLRTFKCTMCNASWSKRFNLQKHIRIRHLGEKPYRCSVCHMSFGTLSHVTRHELTVHKKSNSQTTNTVSTNPISNIIRVGN